MIRYVEENLSRQIHALELLASLLEEEFADLRDRKPQEVSALEFSIQDLMRQIAMERKSLRGMIGATFPGMSRVREVARSLTGEAAESLATLLRVLDRQEQLCAIQADKNRQLAMGLYDQSIRLLKQLHQAVDPGRTGMYSRSGRYAHSQQSQASVFNGRL